MPTTTPYSDEDRNKAIVRLIENKLDFKKTAAETGVSHMTLRRWWKNEAPRLQSEGLDLSEMLRNVAVSMMIELPHFSNGRDWGIALGIVMDKLFLLQGLTPETVAMKAKAELEGKGDVDPVRESLAESLGLETESLKGFVDDAAEILRGYQRAERLRAELVPTENGGGE